MNYVGNVTNRLLVGSTPEVSADIDLLVSKGVTAIINCWEKDYSHLLTAKQGVLYLWNFTMDDGQTKSSEWFSKSLDFALPLFSRPDHRLYVHCAQGRNRGPSTAYAILRALGLSAEDAMRLVKAAACPDAPVRYAPDADAAIRSLGYERT